MARKRMSFFTGRGYGRGKSVEIWISERTENILRADREEAEQQILCSMKESTTAKIRIFVPETALSVRKIGTKTLPILVLKPRLSKDEEGKESEQKDEVGDHSESSKEIEKVQREIDRDV